MKNSNNQRRNETILNEQEVAGGAPASVEPTHMTRSQRIAPLGTPYNGKRKKQTNNPCFVLLGLHIQVSESNGYCPRARCVKHRKNHPSQKDETKFKLVKTWEMTGRGNNTVKMGILECPRCGKRVRRKLDSWGAD
jgi:hypothetical protein